MSLGRNNQSADETIQTVIGYVWNVVDEACMDVISVNSEHSSLFTYLYKYVGNAKIIVYLLFHLYSYYSIETVHL